MGPTKVKTGSSKGQNKRATKPSSSGSSSKGKKPSGIKPKPTQQKTKSSASKAVKKKPPHLRYTEKELKVAPVNGIVPAGVQKPPNAKKGKNFVDDQDQMNAILALVMAEKEGNIESKMMRARHLEAVREARKLEAEKRAEGKKAGFEDRKQGIKDKRKRRGSEADAASDVKSDEKAEKKPRKRVSFG